jgi:uncharacterized membrane protein YfcA
MSSRWWRLPRYFGCRASAAVSGRCAGTPSLAITPINPLYNVVATPGALYRYWRQGQTGGRLALVLIAGTLPGVIAGSVIRVELLPGEDVLVSWSRWS